VGGGEQPLGRDQAGAAEQGLVGVGLVGVQQGRRKGGVPWLGRRTAGDAWLGLGLGVGRLPEQQAEGGKDRGQRRMFRGLAGEVALGEAELYFAVL